MKLRPATRRDYGYYVLILLLCLFIILPIEVPSELASLVNTSVGKAVVVIIAVYLLFTHPVVGVLGLIAAYELVQRSERPHSKGGAPIRQNYPTQSQRTSNLNPLNQFPVTVE